MSDRYNPFVVKLKSAFITKFDFTDRLNIMPQIVEFVLHQSIFSPVLKGTIVFSDTIGLMNNYPISGEETIEVVLSQQGGPDKPLTFIIMAITDIVASDDSRTFSYIMEVASQEAFANAKLRVSKAYEPLPAGEIIKRIYDEYIVTSMLKTNPDYKIKDILINVDTENITLNKDVLVVPNIKPFDAINWICQYAVCKELSTSYTPIFFETIDRFVFKGLQQITYQSTLGQLSAKKQLEEEKYFYISNIDIIKNNPQAYQMLKARGFDESRSISDFKINRRYSGLEKIVGGYFENELIEVNPVQRSRNITYTSIDADGMTTVKYSGSNNNTTSTFSTIVPNKGKVFHTRKYIENIKNEDTREESSASLYSIVNFFQGGRVREKFGNSSRSFLAYQQVDLSIVVPSNLAHVPGDYIYVVMPEFHGFNANQEDRYLSGIFLISEVKTVFMQGGKSVTYLRINRDTFQTSVDQPSRYKL